MGACGDLATVLDRIQAEFALVLGTYQRSNTSVRATPAPSYFASIVDLKVDFADTASKSVRSRIGELQGSFPNLRDQYVNRLTEKSQELSRESTQILGSQLNDFFRGVLGLAEAKIAAQAHTIDSLAVHKT